VEPAASNCVSRCTAEASWLWKLELRWAINASTKAFASCAAPTPELSFPVTSTTSLSFATSAPTSFSSDVLERRRPSCARTASATCGVSTRLAALAAAVCRPFASRSTPSPAKVGSVAETGETRIFAVARYRFGAVSP